MASLVALAHKLGLTVTAEGVERTAQATRLRELGCATAQGWLFARPAPWEEVARLLDAPLALCPTEGGDRGRGGQLRYPLP